MVLAFNKPSRIIFKVKIYLKDESFDYRELIQEDLIFDTGFVAQRDYHRVIRS
jgi:hypothetical protein